MNVRSRFKDWGRFQCLIVPFRASIGSSLRLVEPFSSFPNERQPQPSTSRNDSNGEFMKVGISSNGRVSSPSSVQRVSGYRIARVGPVVNEERAAFGDPCR